MVGTRKVEITVKGIGHFLVGCELKTIVGGDSLQDSDSGEVFQYIYQFVCGLLSSAFL